jgi:hypothetical protein
MIPELSMLFRRQMRIAVVSALKKQIYGLMMNQFRLIRRAIGVCSI